MERRGFLKGILAFGMAPAIVKAEIIMPIRQLISPKLILPRSPLLVDLIAAESLRIAHQKMAFINHMNPQWEDFKESPSDTITIRMPVSYIRRNKMGAI